MQRVVDEFAWGKTKTPDPRHLRGNDGGGSILRLNSSDQGQNLARKSRQKEISENTVMKCRKLIHPVSDTGKHSNTSTIWRPEPIPLLDSRPGEDAGQFAQMAPNSLVIL